MSARNRTSTPGRQQPKVEVKSAPAVKDHWVPGAVVSLFHLAFVAAVGVAVHTVVHDHDWQLPSAEPEVSQGIFLFAACPRCALVDKKARNETSDFCNISELFDSDSHRSWLVWTMVPSLQGIKCGFAAKAAHPVLANAFIGSMALGLLHDILNILCIAKFVIGRDIRAAGLLIVTLVLKMLVVSGLTPFYFWCYNAVCLGLEHKLALFVLIVALFGARFVNICMSITCLGEGSGSENSNIFGQLVTGFAPLFAAFGIITAPFTIATANLGSSAVFGVLGAKGLIFWLVFHAPPIGKFAVNVCLVAQLLDLGIGELFLLETLRHKTGLVNWISISLHGLRASYGGQKGGGEAAFGSARSERIRGQVYVWKDTFLGMPSDGLCSQPFMNKNLHDVNLQGISMFYYRAMFGNLFGFSSGRASFAK